MASKKKDPNDPFRDSVKEIRRARREAGVTKSGRQSRASSNSPDSPDSNPSSPTPKKGSKNTPVKAGRPGPNTKRNLITTDIYGEEQVQRNELEASEFAERQARAAEDYDYSDETNAPVDVAEVQNFVDLASTTRPESEYTLEDYLREGSSALKESDDVVVPSGLNPAATLESGYVPSEEVDDYSDPGSDDEGRRFISRETAAAGSGFDKIRLEEDDEKDEVVDTDIYGTPKLDTGYLGPSRAGSATRRPADSVLSVQMQKEEAMNRRLAETQSRLSRTRSGKWIVPASLPVTPEEALANQQFFGGDEDSDSSPRLRTDDPPLHEGTYTDKDGNVRTGIVTSPNRGFIVPPSRQDTRRRRERQSLEDLAMGSAALADAINQANPQTVRSTTVKRVPKASVLPGEAGKIVAEDTVVPETRSGTTFGDIEGDLTPEQIAQIGKLGTSPTGRSTRSSQAGVFRYLRGRGIGATSRSGPAGSSALGPQLSGLTQRAIEAAEAIDVTPPIDENYDFEIAGLGSAKDFLDEDKLNSIRETIAQGSRNYTPFSNPPRPRPSSSRGGKVDKEAVGEARGGVQLGPTQLVSEGSSEVGNVAAPETQIYNEDTKTWGKPSVNTQEWVAATHARDAEAGYEKGTTLKLLAKQYNLPDIESMDLSSVLSQVGSDPRTVSVTPSQQASRSAAKRPDSDAAAEAMRAADKKTGGERRGVKKLRILRNKAKTVDAPLQQSGLYDAEGKEIDRGTDTGAKADEVFGANRKTEDIIKQQMGSFEGQGGGETSRAGMLNPGSESTNTRAIRNMPIETWRISGSVPISGGRPNLTDDDRSAMKVTHPALESALDPATGAGRLVVTGRKDDKGNPVTSGVLPPLKDKATGKLLKKEGTGEVFGPKIDTPGTIKGVAVGNETGTARVQPLPPHLANQFGATSDYGTTPLVAGNPYSNDDPFGNAGDLRFGPPMTGGTKSGVPAGRIIPPQVDDSGKQVDYTEAELRNMPQVKRAAGEKKRRKGIEAAKQVSAAAKYTDEDRAADKAFEDRATAARASEALDTLKTRVSRSQFTLQSPQEQRSARMEGFLGTSEEETQRNPLLAAHLADLDVASGGKAFAKPAEPVASSGVQPGSKYVRPILGGRSDDTNQGGNLGMNRGAAIGKVMDQLRYRSGIDTRPAKQRSTFSPHTRMFPSDYQENVPQRETREAAESNTSKLNPSPAPRSQASYTSEARAKLRTSIKNSQ